MTGEAVGTGAADPRSEQSQAGDCLKSGVARQRARA